MKMLELDLDYKVLKTLFRSETPIKVGDLSKLLKFPHSTIGSCVKRLEEKKQVIYNRYKPVLLTEKGKNLAIELIRHSRLLEMLLINELDLDKEIAHEESEKFNLLFSCETINKICQKYNHPTECPCGESILSSQRCNCTQKGHE